MIYTYRRGLDWTGSALARRPPLPLIAGPWLTCHGPLYADSAKSWLGLSISSRAGNKRRGLMRWAR